MKTSIKLVAIVALVVFIGLTIYYSSKTEYPSKLALFEGGTKEVANINSKKALVFDPTNLSPQICGITPEGVIYLSDKALTGYNDFTVVVFPERGLAKNQTLNQAGAKIYYPMLKQGDYYLAKPDTIYPNTLYYFLSSALDGVVSFPTSRVDKFTQCELIKNNYGEYAIKH